METKIEKITLRAIDTYDATNIVDNSEVDSHKGFIKWGSENDYPQFLNSLYSEVATLHSIIEGTVDYVVGEGVTLSDTFLNERVNPDDDPTEFVRNIARDYLIYHGFAIDVVRNKAGEVCAIYHIPLERIRINEAKDTFYYSKDWTKNGRVKYITYPAFDINKQDPHSIYYYISDKTNTYPIPLWSAAVTAAQIETEVNKYHLNSICNGFSANYFIGMNNGIPSEQEANEIEQDMIDKFTGSNNGGRLMINFANDKEHSAEVMKLETDDAGERYKSLVERARQQIFTAFRATPTLFGLNQETTGFSDQDYSSAFKLYNKTFVGPIQKIIKRSMEYILNVKVDIAPFEISFDKNNE